MALKNLNELEKIVQDKVFCVETGDIEIPESFKEKVTAIQKGTSVAYNRYTLVYTNAQGQKIFSPNHVFYIASCLVEVYDAVMEYKETLESLFSSQWIKELDSEGSLNDHDTKVIETAASLSDDEKEWLKKFCNDYSWWGGGKSIGRNDFYFSPVLGTANVVAASNSLLGDLTKFLSENKEYNAILQDCLTMSYFSTASEGRHGAMKDNIQTVQKIYYGCPGTGKSHTVKEQTEGIDGAKVVCFDDGTTNIFRTTFHPDFDYTTFVGCYKPFMDGEHLEYKFVPQVFTNAYVAAKKHPDTPVYLIIEEINRGNCAQIFGDLFQLLDRRDGVSMFPISPDQDLQKYLKEEAGLEEWRTLRLPRNFNIYATMNTSDQSLFPMDSAFKRRWDMEYVGIDYDKKAADFSIKVNGTSYSWLEYLRRFNELITDASDSEDKQMGEFFIRQDMDAEEFKNKVMFYLWNDICKDLYAGKNSPQEFFFRDNFGKPFKFTQLFIKPKSDEEKDKPETDGDALLAGFLHFVMYGKEKKKAEDAASQTDETAGSGTPNA